jgi:glycosyltransferase involved in cell wall biosynthesis
MKIGFVIYGSLDALSGGYLYDRKLVEYLRTQGDTVEVISLPWRNYAAHLTDNLSFKLPANLDILIQDELNHPSLIGANRNKHPYPVISLVHHLRCSELRATWQNTLYRDIEKRYLSSVDGFIFNSQTTKKVVNNLLENVILSEAKDLGANQKETLRSLRPLRVTRSNKPSIVAYPPTDRFSEAIPVDEIKTRAANHPLQIIFLGNVIERKGLHIVLEALRHQTSDIRLEIVGSLDSEPKYAQAMQAKASDLKSKVTFHSSLDHEPLKKLLRAAHVLVVPSSYEGFGIVYLEGMAFGLPAIGTTAGAAGEIITNNETGYLIEPNDSVSLAARLSSLSQDRALLTQLSINARNRYLQQPAWNKTAGQIRTFLQAMIR